MAAFVIHPDGTYEESSFLGSDGDFPDVDALQNQVGGYFEIISSLKSDYYFYINDSGLSDNLPPNRTASLLADYLGITTMFSRTMDGMFVGTVVVTHRTTTKEGYVVEEPLEKETVDVLKKMCGWVSSNPAADSLEIELDEEELMFIFGIGKRVCYPKRVRSRRPSSVSLSPPQSRRSETYELEEGELPLSPKRARNDDADAAAEKNSQK